MKDIKNKSILITGGAGFIGSNIVDYLVQNNFSKIFVLDNLITGSLRNIETHIENKKIEFIKGDITNYQTCLNATKNIDVILHQAALGSVPRSIEDPVNTHNVNVNGFMNVLESARQNKVQRFVYASSSSVYGDDNTLPKLEKNTGNPLSPYAVSKKINELYARVFGELYGIEIIGLRYFNVFGPKQNPSGPYAAVIPIFINNILINKPCFIFGDGNNRRDFTYVTNVVHANILAASCENKQAYNEVFNIAYGSTKSINDLYSQIKEKLNSTASVSYKNPRVGEIKDSFADITKAKELLGYSPLIPLDKGIELSVEWYKQNSFE